MPSVIIPISRISCSVIIAARLKNASSRYPPKMLPVMCLVGGMYFSGASGNSSRTSWAWASSSRNESGTSGPISNAWPRPIWRSARPASLPKYSLSNWDTMTVCAPSTGSAVVR